jgi:cytochrome c oxidase assembly protein subunit 15
MRVVPTLALATLLAAYATVVLGGYVSNIGAGLACPDWPTCHGQLIPPLGDPAVLAEYMHRLAAVLAGIFALATLVLVWWRRRSHTALVTAITVGFGLLVLQVALGALTVTSLLEPVVVTAHLGVATAFIAMMTLTTVLAFRPGRPTGPLASGKGNEEEAKGEHEDHDEAQKDPDLHRVRQTSPGSDEDSSP